MTLRRHFALTHLPGASSLAGALLAGALISTTLTACAASTRTASQNRSQGGGQTASPPPRLTDLREEFDPEPYRDDGLLIQPEFGSPVSTPSMEPADPSSGPSSSPALTPVGPAASSPDTSGPGREVATGQPDSTTVYRVQVMALSSEETALSLADALRRRITASVNVRPDGGLFMVRAGESSSPTVAEALRVHIVGLGGEYADAYVITERIAVESAWDDGSDIPDGAALDLPPPDEAPAPVPVELVRTSGGRVLLDQFESYQQATSFRQSAVRRLQRNGIDAAVDIVFAAPRHKVVAGNFRTAGEAQELTERVVGLGYRNALKVRGEVYLPKEGN